jgi:predicted glutamine amidotransferase
MRTANGQITPDLITPEQIAALLLECQKRGTHATGACLQDAEGQIVWYKEPKPAWEFLAGSGWKAWIQKHLTPNVHTAILHTRAATCGDPAFPVNNHPLTVGRSAVVHNGIINNHHGLFNDLKLKRNGDVDSDIIRAILDENGLTADGVRELNKMNGWAAVAAVSSDFPNKLLLARSGSPLVLGLIESKNQLIWCSTKDGIHNATRNNVQKWGIWFRKNVSDVMFNPVEDDVAMMWSPDGLEEGWPRTFNISSYKRTITHTPFSNNAAKKKEKRQEENRAEVKAKQDAGAKRTTNKKKPDVMECPNSKGCTVMITFSKMQEDVPLWKMECPGCGASLGEKE